MLSRLFLTQLKSIKLNVGARSASSFINGTNSSYVDAMYSSWKQDPKSVHISWQMYFNSNMESFTAPPSLSPSTPVDPSSSPILTSNLSDSASTYDVKDHMKVQLLVRAHQIRGHLLAKLDPLEINVNDIGVAPELDYKFYGFTEADLSRTFHLGSGILPRFINGNQTPTLQEIIDMLRNTYSGHIGIEYGHINDRHMCDWIRDRIEVPTPYRYSKEKKLVILDRLMWSDSFERFVSQKYPSEKRFGLEGCESLIPGMKAMIDRSVELGVSSINMGMPHRGRLNVLSNVVRKPNESIFSEFTGSLDNSVEGSGDVKYHLGMNYFRPTPSGKMVHLSLNANPSHLEAVDPVVLGKVRGLQFYQNDERDGDQSMAVLLHGDAAFAGQGVVYETLGLTELPAYTTGGSIHIIVNNQIGFTTDPRFSRSTPYCSDVAKTVDAPILHVNADDVEAVTFAMEFASEWRQKWKNDVVIDLVCYRKHGHNEIDQPGFTQPVMYKKIKTMKPVVQKYIDQLLSEGEVTAEEIDQMKKRIWGILEKNYEDSKTYESNSVEWVSSTWPGFKAPAELAEQTVSIQPTGVDKELLVHVGRTTGTAPSSFTVHPNLAKILKARADSVIKGDGIDYATAEAMAFGSLLVEGTHVRLSGQDVERGTFSQRHSVLHDQVQDTTPYVPLNHLQVPDLVPTQAKFSVCNSSLSEFGILGFELGYSMVNPNQLVMWEAQFGDFANTAQCIIDQFISCGEQKWLQRSGLTLLLPHGYDGQGPEHSSGRIERFLQLIDEDPYRMPELDHDGKGSYSRQHQDINMAVVYPSTPSNYFHALRRQVHRDFRKPLIVFNSKALLRHPMAKSNISEMVTGTRFQRVIPEVLHPSPLSEAAVAPRNNVEPRLPYGLVGSEHPLEASDVAVERSAMAGDFTLSPPNETRTLIFCTGQVYYLLSRARALNGLKDVAIVRIEQLTPFPFWEVKSVVDFYENLEEVVWCQEEPFNAGAWAHIEPRMETALRETRWYKDTPKVSDREPKREKHLRNKENNLKSQEKHESNDKPSFFSRLLGGSKSESPATTSSLKSLSSQKLTTLSKGREWQETLLTKLTPGGLDNLRKSSRPDISVRGGRTVRYAGRDQSAAPATGIKKQHKFEEATLLSEALYGGELKTPVDYVQGIPKFQ